MQETNEMHKADEKDFANAEKTIATLPTIVIRCCIVQNKTESPFSLGKEQFCQLKK
ncbi:MAG: hypothetical protein DHS20C18_20010 [Saprospiraceae bacterium]|nr:MAG: hypothetical protein DHS20C18_20010 [Saprospiraceae bacterium]